MKVLFIYPFQEGANVGRLAECLGSRGIKPVLSWQAYQPESKFENKQDADIKNQLSSMLDEMPYVVYYVSEAAAGDTTKCKILSYEYQAVLEKAKCVIPILESPGVLHSPDIYRMFGHSYCLIAKDGLKSHADCERLSEKTERIFREHEKRVLPSESAVSFEDFDDTADFYRKRKVLLISPRNSAEISLLAFCLKARNILPVNTLREYEKNVDIKGQLVKMIDEAHTAVFYVSREVALDPVYADVVGYMFRAVRDKAKVIVPILEDRDIRDLPKMRSMFGTRYCLYRDAELPEPKDIERLADAVNRIVSESGRYTALNKKLVSCKELRDTEGIVRTAAEMLHMVRTEPDVLLCRAGTDQTPLRQLVSLTELLERCNEPDHSDHSLELAKCRLNAVGDVLSIDFSPKLQDLGLLADALRLIYLGAQIRFNCLDTLAKGNERVKSAKIAVSDIYQEQTYIDMQRPYYESFQALLKKRTEAGLPLGATEAETGRILLAQSCIFGITAHLHVTAKPQGTPADFSEKEKTALFGIAESLRSIVESFNDVRDPAFTAEFYRCVRKGYKRLQEYCEILGCIGVGRECIEQIEVLDKKLAEDAEETADDSMVAGMKTLLGFFSAAGKRYDVFISYRHTDAELANDLHELLKENLLLPFMDSYDLAKIGNSDFYSALDTALACCTHFVLLVTDLKDLKSEWIRHEMETFFSLMQAQPDKHINFLFIAGNDAVKAEFLRDKALYLEKEELHKYEILSLVQDRMKIPDYLRFLPNDET